MSIATLKRKTNAKYNNVSVGVKQFSLNGGYRNQGWVGQTSLSRSLPRTLMVGTTPRGHGGTSVWRGNGARTYKVVNYYPRGTIVQSGVQSTNDNRVIKRSVLNYEDRMQFGRWQQRWTNTVQRFQCTQCNTNFVKPDTNHNLGDQADYISMKTKRVQCCERCTPKPTPTLKAPCTTCRPYTPTTFKTNSVNIFKNRINTPQSYSEPYPNAVTKATNSRYALTRNLFSYVPISQGENLQRIESCTVQNDIRFQALQNRPGTRKNGAGILYNP
jgi:hypothetical protein